MPEARDLAVGLFLGVIQPREAITWADSWIMYLDDPPYWLIELSTSPNAYAHDLLKWIQQAVLEDPPSDSEFLGAMAFRFIDLHEPVGKILPLLFGRFCSCEWTEMTPIRQQVYLIDDQLDWDPSLAAVTAGEFLMPFVAGGREQRNRIKNDRSSL